MSDEKTPVPYGSMFQPGDATDTPEVTDAPVEVAPVVDAPPVEEDPTFVMVNLTTNGSLRVREEADADAAVVTLVPNGAVLRVISATNPDFTFVEADDGGSPVRGYVKNAFVVEAPAPVV